MNENNYVHIGKLAIHRSKALICIVYILIMLLFVNGLFQNLDKSVDNRIKFHAVPIAISTLYQGHKHDYRGWRSTEIPFQNLNRELSDELIFEQIQTPIDKKQGHYYWVADDRGYADYIIAAFAIFGPHMKSLYHFWFVIFLVSVTLFVFAFHRQIWAMAFLALLLLGIHSASMLLKLVPISVAIYEPRYLEVLTLVSMCHMIFFAVLFDKKDIRSQFFGLSGQLLIFAFLYHARSSLGWEIVAVIGISSGLIILRKNWNRIASAFTVVGSLVCTLVLLISYKHATYHKSYFEDMGARTFWHNAIMGLKLKSLPKNMLGDHYVATFVIQHAKDSKQCMSCIENLEPQELLNTLGNWGAADWIAYENCARHFFFSMVSRYKWETLRLYLFKKPFQVLIDLGSAKTDLYQDEKKELTPKTSLPWNPFHLFYLMMFGFISFFSVQSIYLYRRQLLGITLVVFVTGMIPSVCFYSDILTRGGLSATMLILLYLMIAICWTKMYHWIKRIRQTMTIPK